MMHQTVFHASCAILCPEKGIFYCRPVFLNTANPHQDFVVWIKMGFAQGAGSSRDRRQSIASATLPSIGQTRQQERISHRAPPVPHFTCSFIASRIQGCLGGWCFARDVVAPPAHLLHQPALPHPSENAARIVHPQGNANVHRTLWAC